MSKLRYKFEAAVTPSGSEPLSGLSIITGDVEAAGHGCFVDATSIKQVADLLSGKTAPSYLTHDGAFFQDRLGQEIGLFSNVRLDGNKVRADFSWLDSFSKNEPKKFGALSELIVKAPGMFGLSIVFSGSLSWVSPDGTEVSADQERPAGADVIPHIRFSEVFSVDFVGSPAANPSGLFSAQDGDGAVTLSAHTAALSAVNGELAKAKEQIVAKDAELEKLKKDLKEAETYDSRKIGAPPVNFRAMGSEEPASKKDKYAHYKSMPAGKARDEYFKANKADIWSAARAES